MHKHNFGGLNVEIGANWVEGVGGDKLNPIWPIVNSTLKLRNFYSDFDSVVGNVYKEEYVNYILTLYIAAACMLNNICMVKTTNVAGIYHLSMAYREKKTTN